MAKVRPTLISFGGTAAMVTSMGLILGLERREALLSTAANLATRLPVAPVAKEVAKHGVAAALVLAISRWVGTWISGSFA